MLLMIIGRNTRWNWPRMASTGAVGAGVLDGATTVANSTNGSIRESDTPSGKFAEG